MSTFGKSQSPVPTPPISDKGSKKSKTKLCNICKSVRVPVGTHACHLCD